MKRQIASCVILLSWVFALGFGPATAQGDGHVDFIRMRVAYDGYLHSEYYRWGEDLYVWPRLYPIPRDTSVEFWFSIYLSDTTDLSGTHYEVGYRGPTVIEAGHGGDYVCRCPIYDGIPGGWYYVAGIFESPGYREVVVHPTQIIVVPPGPDLSIGAFGPSQAVCRPGETLAVSATVQNTGDETANTYTFDCYLGDQHVGGATRSMLEEGKTDTFEVVCTLPPNTPEGEYEIPGIVTCSADFMPGNNGATSHKVRVGPYPDLALETLSMDAGPYMPAGEIIVHSLARNVGDQTSTSYEVDYDVSINGDITAADSHPIFPKVTVISGAYHML